MTFLITSYFCALQIIANTSVLCLFFGINYSAGKMVVVDKPESNQKVKSKAITLRFHIHIWILGYITKHLKVDKRRAS
jgi:hypothetical protein